MAREQRLSAFLAQRDGVKTRTNKEFTQIQGVVSKGEFFAGMTKSYEKRDESGEDYPTQAVRVRNRVNDVLEELRELVTDQFNAEATVDAGNLTASASVEVNGQTLLSDVPVTTLLTLERDLKQVRQFLARLPTLDPAYDWKRDEAAGLYKTDEVRTNRTAKVQKPIVLYDATEKHPAQTQLITTDEVVGEWVTINASGAIPADEKRQYLKRCDILLDAVKTAREEANAVKTAAVDVGGPIFDFILGSN